MGPKLSVIVPAYNCEATIVPCLRAIRDSEEKEIELIVVDDGSRDRTGELARLLADVFVQNAQNQGRTAARFQGFEIARAKVLVNVDSDVLIPSGMLGAIDRFFAVHPRADALSALLSKDSPAPGYFSQYKNLYMHYRFRDLPDEINFLYGSLFALRRECAIRFESPARIADDTAAGQELLKRGKRIFLLRSPAVIHLKTYDFRSWILNDFRISSDWAKIYWVYRGWQQLGLNRPGFAHASLAQILSLVLTPAALLAALGGFYPSGQVLLLAGWFSLNVRFFFFLFREKGILFALRGIAVTFLDYLVMGMGVLTGFLACVLSRRYSAKGSPVR